MTLTDAVGGAETTTTWLVVKREVETVSWARRGDAAKTVLAAAFDAGARGAPTTSRSRSLLFCR